MASSRAQQAAIAISMKKAGKKPKSLSKAQNGAIMIGPGYSSSLPTRKSKALTKRKLKLDTGFDATPSSYALDLKKRGVKLDSGFDSKPSSYKGKALKKGGSTPAWQRKEGKNPEGGLNARGVASYRKENPGSKLQTAVTKKPSKLDPDSKDAKRRKSFCARMKGHKKKNTSAKTANDPNSRINKSLRKWNC